ncbi:hypothetical protein LUZ60_005888 [Juncus effusus]|nr:hypothetical protein LUZ60_005888 [Juncus effusus]
MAPLVRLLLRRVFSTAVSSPSSLSSPRPWLFIGLGNPGEKFRSTRHNAGFDMIDAFARSQGISINTVHCKALVGEGMIEGVPILLAKPQTYMNLSGESTGALAAYYKLPLNRVLVMYDDMDLPCGVLRLQPKGGHAHHKGLKNVIHHFHANREFARLRVGIGRPPGQMDPRAFLLQIFTRTSRERIDVAIEEGVDVLKMVISNGLTEAAKLFNTEQKYKHLKVQNLPV